jgi:hypothetical protein
MKPEGVGPCWPKLVSGASKDPEAATEKQRVSAEHEEVGPAPRGPAGRGGPSCGEIPRMIGDWWLDDDRSCV